VTGIYIAGWAHSIFGRLEAPDVETLIGMVVQPAIASASINASEIDAVFVGHFNSGFSKQNFPSSLAMSSCPELRFRPATRVENACASGSAAIFAGLDFISSGRGETALVIGVEKMTSAPSAAIATNLLGASYWPEESGLQAGFVGVFAEVAKRYFELFGEQSDALAAIAAKNHQNGLDNPYAQLKKDLGFEFCRTVSAKNPIVAHPLKRTDCSPVSDGAAALVLTNKDTAAGLGKSVHFRGMAHANDLLPMSARDMSRFEAGERAWHSALQASGLSLSELSFVETHDCFTIAELIEYEAMGLTPRGKGAQAILEGWTAPDGRLPINRSGGLKSKGHPVGATGVSMHIMAAMQLVGEAGAMQLPKADIAGVYNMGGSGVANYVTVLERR
jgi:acetyl-CoA C-acetyltransferase